MKKITKEQAKILAKFFKIDLKKTPFKEYLEGLNIEREHADVIHGDVYTLGLIVNAHLRENPRYYYYLKKAGL
jgi:hypothetical protein